MTEELTALLQRARELGAAADESGWSRASDATAIAEFTGSVSSDLFAAAAGEPLVVALFGGTGVGKSSLLNRLVGEQVARVGVIRPTSLEATVYVHEDVQFNAAPRAGFLHATHRQADRRYVVWVDMPDIDSTALSNRQLVLDFLPYVDVLVYVVSPERYRDEAPWALLSEHAAGSAWVFVMNQADRGTPQQLDDLRAVLGRAGFDDPVLIGTSCTVEIDDDQFGQLEELIDDLAAERTRALIQREGRLARQRELLQLVDDLGTSWPTDDKSLLSAWQVAFGELSTELTDDLVARLAPAAARLAENEHVAPGDLWDEWADDRLEDALTATAVAARQAGWTAPTLEALQQVGEVTAGHRADSLLRDSVRRSLARPGTPFQRWLHGMSERLVFGLPLLALAWIGYFILRGFYSGATGSGEFVAEGFVINAALLVALAAGVPYLIARLSRPSPQRAALKGIEDGLNAVLERVDSAAQGVLAAAVAELTDLREKRNDLLAEAAPDDDATSEATRRLRGRAQGE